MASRRIEASGRVLRGFLVLLAGAGGVLVAYAPVAIGLVAVAGAIGYLTKDAGRQDIRRALEAASAGQSVLDAEVRERLVRFASIPSPTSGDSVPPDGLTAREVEVLGLIAAGLSNSEIASEL